MAGAAAARGGACRAPLTCDDPRVASPVDDRSGGTLPALDATEIAKLLHPLAEAVGHALAVDDRDGNEVASVGEGLAGPATAPIVVRAELIGSVRARQQTAARGAARLLSEVLGRPDARDAQHERADAREQDGDVGQHEAAGLASSSSTTRAARSAGVTMRRWTTAAGCRSGGGCGRVAWCRRRIIHRMRLRRALVLASALAVLVAPAARAADAPGASLATPAEQSWLLAVEQDLTSIADAGRSSSVTGGSAQRAAALLASPQDLFGSAVVYAVFSSCSQQLKGAGTPSKRLTAVRDGVAAACRPLVRASELFLSAVREKKPAALIAAEGQALVGAKQMARAAERLRAFRKAHK